MSKEFRILGHPEIKIRVKSFLQMLNAGRPRIGGKEAIWEFYF